MTDVTQDPALATGAANVEWGDTSFTPETRQSYDNAIRFFRMSASWPDKPFEDRVFQLGGKERVAFLSEQLFVCWTHRFSVQWMKSGVNGTRRCTLETLGHCKACEHYEAAPMITEPDGKTKKDARCGRRTQTFACNLLVYKTDLEGTLLDPQGRKIVLHPEKGPVLMDNVDTAAELVTQVFLWRFSADKFVAIRDIKTEWGSLLKNDVLFTLTPGKPENFQDFAPTVSRNSALRELLKANPEQAKAIVEKYKEDKYDVEAIMGKQYSDEDMLKFLGIMGGPASMQQSVSSLAADVEAELAKLMPDAGPPPTVRPPAPAPTPAAVGAVMAEVDSNEAASEALDAPVVQPPPTDGDFDSLLA